MSDLKQFKLPDVGEGLTEAEIVTWKVKVGDELKVNDVIVEIETAKSLVELPSPFAGTVSELLASEGDTVEVGSPIISVSVGGEAAPATSDATADAQDAATDAVSAESPPAAVTPDPTGLPEALVPRPKDDEPVEPGLIGGPAPGGRTSVLVGYGPRTTDAKRRPRKSGPVPTGASRAAAQAGVQHAFTPYATTVPEVSLDDAPEAAPAVASGASPKLTASPSAKVLAKPPVRKLARDLGVDLTGVSPTSPDGVITRSDVEAQAGGVRTTDSLPDAAARPNETGVPVVSPRGSETRVPVKGVRKMTAQAMVSSAFTAPHVTEWVTFDITQTMELVDRLKAHRDFRDVKVSPLLVIAKAVCIAVRRTPEINATWDDAAQEIVIKHDVNLGIAAATSRGLVVPNVVGADSLTLRQLADRLVELTVTAREGKTQPAQMAGGTFTITNVGVFGVDAGTPILNPGESGILAIGAISRRPWVVDDEVVPRWVTTLALSFDHRVVDGEQGSRFLADVAGILEDPATALLF